ncbi:MAG: CBS domain-containing protein [Spirochaetota bacterium]|nr:CBS domain-containing protein [Spirochaetota bacterium]
MDSEYAKTQVILLELRISDVMRKDVITLHPNDKMSHLRETLKSYRISGVPIIDGDELVGIISIEDLIRWLSDGGGDYAVSDKMTRNPDCFFADQPLMQVMRLFDELGYGRFPVLDRKSKRMVGILTKGDIIEGVMRKLEHEYKEEEIRQYRASHIFEDIIADYKEINLIYRVIGQDFERAGLASTSMKRNFKRLGIRPDIIHRLAIASYEAEMNVVIYTNGGIMEYRVTPDEIYLKIEDQGPGIEDIDKALEPGYSTAADWIRELGFGAGMGLCNIKKNADKMEINSIPGVGTTLIIRILTEDSNEIESNS